MGYPYRVRRVREQRLLPLPRQKRVQRSGVVLGGWIVPGRQQPYCLSQRDFTRQVKMRLLAGDIGVVDGQGSGNVAAAGEDGDQPAAANPR